MKTRINRHVLAGLAVAIAAMAVAAPAAADERNYEFKSWKGQYCKLTTNNWAWGPAGDRTIHFADTLACTRTMGQISLGIYLDGGGRHFGPYGGGCLWPSPCGPPRMTYDQTVIHQPSGVYRHETRLRLNLLYQDQDFWYWADERAACTYTGISATSGDLKCDLIEVIPAEP
jgi:hypothetical protein